MIKRTGELTLTILGMVIALMVFAFGIFAKTLKNTQELQDLIKQSNATNNASITADDMVQAVHMLGTSLILSGIIGFIIALVASFFIKGNKKPKLAGTLLIIAALITVILSVGIGLLVGILFLIAAIMCFVRKPKTT
ncbi:DUF4064 domain-containing protein [Terrilactibacillus sp. BCM23-1]|uniref:DUF4064 domain-containing protein n=1 Tax=Terrilactibacillus tamarindi TaxID=2599694 RepID=A0A6N8CR00_9BACI|nr:DUF4064 domain-containing protein [Terrilactibacillus tamarindi]MTT32471.1 DUF4064 domain-containing protein [Terrilactibacillus tamarindi]